MNNNREVNIPVGGESPEGGDRCILDVPDV